MRTFLLLFLILDTFSSAQAAESCPFCPPAYCQNVELAARLKTAKKQSAEASGLPKRLSGLFDQLGDCRACVEYAPDWPHLVVEYDGDALSDYYGRDIESYSTSRAWSAAGEYQARKDMRAGLIARFHITLGSEPCVCCKAKNVDEYEIWAKADPVAKLRGDPKWNSRLRIHATRTISVTTIDDAQIIPEDLSDIPPNRRMEEPSPGQLSDFKTAAPSRIVQVLCPNCQSLADLYNQQGGEINKTNDTLASVQRDLSYEQDMAEYSRSMVDSLNAVAGTPSVIADQKFHGTRMQKALANVNQLQSRATQLSQHLAEQKSKQTQLMSELRDCESTQCLPKEDNPPRLEFPTVDILVPAGNEPRAPTEPAVIDWPDDVEAQTVPADLPPLEVFWLGEILLDHPIDAECPAPAGDIYIASNNGHPLAVSPIEDDGKIAEFLDHAISGDNTPTPVISSTYNCEAKKPRRLKGSLSTTVTDTVTGESIDVNLPASGQISKPPKLASDPNAEFAVDRQGIIRGPSWNPIQTNCPSCSKIVDQYNQTMQRVFKARRAVVLFRDWLNKFRKPGSLDWNSDDADKITSYIALIEGFEQLLAEHKAILLELEHQASYLQSVIRDCEQQQCKKKDRTKLIAIDVPGVAKKSYFTPNTSAILEEHQFHWDGPYATDCLPCKPIVDQLNAVPGWLTRTHHKIAWHEHEIRNWEMQVTTIGGSLLIDDSKVAIPRHNQSIDTLKNEISALRKLMRELQASLALCQKKYCGKDSSGKPRLAMPSAIIDGKALLIEEYSKCETDSPGDPIIVGPNNEVGSSAQFKETATKKAVGAAVGALAGLAGFGGGGGGGAAEQGPPTYKDPIKNRDKTKVKSKNPKREIRVGAGFTDEGLLVSSDIRSAPGKGTFHSAVLLNERGWQLLPWELYMYEIWGEWNLSVSWTRDTFVDGELVKHEEGGWNESWKELLAQGESVNYVEIQQEPLWKRLGFNTATSGAKSLGTVFPVSPAMLAKEPLDLFLHLSDPKKDPVPTVPYHFKLSLDDKGKVLTEHIDSEAEIQPRACSNREFQLISEPPSGNVVGAPVTTQAGGDYVFLPGPAADTPGEIVFEVDGQRIVSTLPSTTSPAPSTGTMELQTQPNALPDPGTADSLTGEHSPQQGKPSQLDWDDDDVMDENKINEILKDPSKFGRRLTQQEIENLKTKPSEWDRDGDGIQNEADTMPDVPSDSFIAGSTIGTILNPNGQAVKIFGSNGDGNPMHASDGVSVEVGDAPEGGSPRVEILGVEFEVDPGTILEASFG